MTSDTQCYYSKLRKLFFELFR